MRIVEASALATTDHYRRTVRLEPLPLEVPTGTALVTVQPARQPDPVARCAAGPNAGFVMQLIATAEPMDVNASERRTVYVPGVAAAAYRAAASQIGRPANDTIGMSRTI